MSINPRFLPNPFASAGKVPPFDPGYAFSQALTLLPELHECAERGAMLQSTGKWRRDYSVYTGLAGVALAYLRLAMHCKHARGDGASSDNYLQKAKDTIHLCLEAEPQSREVSFFCGTPGYLAIRLFPFKPLAFPCFNTFV